MATQKYFSHEDPQGNMVWKIIKEEGYNFQIAGENLAVNYTGENHQHIFSSWMNSPAHRKNILENRFKETGIGVARGDYKKRPAIFIVVLFGKEKYDPFFSFLN